MSIKVRITVITLAVEHNESAGLVVIADFNPRNQPIEGKECPIQSGEMITEESENDGRSPVFAGQPMRSSPELN